MTEPAPRNSSALKKACVNRWKIAAPIGADAERHEHVAELRAGRIGDDALDVVLHEADGRREEGGDGADEGHDGQRRVRQLEERRQPRHHEHAGGHHGRGMDQRRDRRRAFHGVRQPGVQRNCADLPMAPMNSSRQTTVIADCRSSA